MKQSPNHSYGHYFLMYFFYFLSIALFSTLISVYLLDKGFKPSQVSFVVSLSFLASMCAQPIIGLLSSQFSVKTIMTLAFSMTLMGSCFFLLAQSIWFYALSYSLVLLLLNGVNPIIEQLATTSPFSYGRLRIWGTIGYAVGSQMAGLIYDQISPQAIYITFLVTIALAIIGVRGTACHLPRTHETASKPHQLFQALIKNRLFLSYLVITMLYTGVTNIGHTYIPAMLERDGLSVGISTTIVSLSVLCESPLILFSSLFMDKLRSKQLFFLSVSTVLLQYTIYALDSNIASKVVMTLLAKHAAGMLFVMVNLKIVSSLVDRYHLVLALAVIQTGQYLSSIVFQYLAGQVLNTAGYTSLCWVLVGVLAVVFLGVSLLKLPSGTQQRLFS